MTLGGTGDAVFQFVTEEASSWARFTFHLVPDSLGRARLALLGGLVEDGFAVGAFASSIDQGIRTFLGAVFVG